MIERLNALFAALSPLWEMSLTAAYAAAIVAGLRLILKKRAPRQVLCLLWLVVFARLLIPLSLESPVSIVPDALPRQEQHLAEPAIPPASAQGTGSAQNPAGAQAPGGITADPVTQIQPGGVPVLTAPEGAVPQAPAASAPFPWQAVLAGVWLAGALAMGGYGLLSYLRLRRRLFDAIRAGDGVWEHPSVASPFILGVLRPRIYLPAGLYGQPRQFILCHERAHLRRLDHIVKPVCWLALALHWFNPLVWAAYLLMSRDIEAACDEAVIRSLGPQVKADYSATLLSLATSGRMPAPCPLAFDEGDAKGRIQNVLRYRRPALWIVVVSVVMVVMAAVCLLTDPVSAQAPGENPDPIPSASAPQPPEESGVLDPWMREVLDGERQFARGSMETEQFSISQLCDMVYRGERPDLILEVGKLAVMDLDRDGINEMVVWPVGGEPDDTTEIGYTVGYFIFRRQGDKVTVHYIGWRPMQNLKADGTFEWSSSAWNAGISRLIDIDTFETEDITWFDTPSVDDDNYFVDGLRATREEFEAAYAAQSAKPEPAWYTYAGGVLSPWRPDNLELAAQTGDRDSGEAKLWLEGGEIPWLEWNGAAVRLNSLITPAQAPFLYCWDFDGDGQDEVAVTWLINGYAQYGLYEWESGQPTLKTTYDSQQMLVRFNQNNTAAVGPGPDGGLALTVNYVHVEGEDTPDSEDFYRRYVTGRALLPDDFFDGGYEHIRDGYPHAYANGFHLVYLQRETGKFYFDFDIYLADETMRELNYVDTLLGDPPHSEYAGHYMLNKPVGVGGFYLSYDGAAWKLEEWDQITMDYPDPTASSGSQPSVSPGPSLTPEPAVSPEAEVKQVGNGYQVSWGGRSFAVDPSVTPDLCADIYQADFDGDGRNEVAFALWASPVWMIDLLDNGSAVASVFDPASLRGDLAVNSVAAITPSGGMTFTYSWGALDESTRRYVSTSANFPGSFFQGGNEALKSGKPLTVSTANGGVRAYTNVLYPYLDVSVTVALQVEEGGTTAAGRVVGFQHYTVRYDGGGFTVDVPGQLDIVSDSPQGSTPSQPARAPAAECAHGLDTVSGVIQGNRYTLVCKQDGYVYTVPSPVEAYNCEPLPGADCDGDGHIEHAFQMEDGRLVVCDFKDGRLVNRVFDPGALFAGFDQDRACEVVDDANAAVITCQGQTVRVPLDRGYVLTHHGPNPQILLAESGTRYAGYTFQEGGFDLAAPVDLSACGLDGTALYAHWNIRCTESGLQEVPGSFRLEVVSP